MVGVIIGGSVFGEDAASFHVAGMQVSEERSAHVYWLEESPLKNGDLLEISPLELASSSKPISVEWTDSAEYIEKHRQYDDFIKAHTWPRPVPVERRPNVALNLAIPGFPTLHARLPLRHKHLLCSVDWNSFRPMRTRVFVRSFAEVAYQLDWLRADLPLGETLRVEVRV